MVELDEASFEEAIGRDPVLVDFWAPWCKPCRAIEPVLEQLPLEVLRVNVDEQPALAARYEVLSIPTVSLFVGGERRGSVVGARPLQHFERWLADLLPT